jgi:hypothetical protein
MFSPFLSIVPLCFTSLLFLSSSPESLGTVTARLLGLLAICFTRRPEDDSSNIVTCSEAMLPALEVAVVV